MKKAARWRLCGSPVDYIDFMFAKLIALGLLAFYAGYKGWLNPPPSQPKEGRDKRTGR